MAENETKNTTTSKRGLASATEATRARVARSGGQAVSRNREHMSQIGQKGGSQSGKQSRTRSQESKESQESHKS